MFWGKKPKEPPRIANAFWVLDRELERMHTLLRGEMSRNESNAQEFWKRIKLMEDTLVKCAAESDHTLHEKIAEFALAGTAADPNETKKTGD